MNATIQSRHESLENTKTKLEQVKLDINDIKYIGDDKLVSLQKQLTISTEQHELYELQEQHKKDLVRLNQMKDDIINDLNNDLKQIINDLWKEHDSRESLLSDISDNKECIEDVKQINRLKISIEKYQNIDTQQLNDKRTELQNLITELNQKQSLHKKLKAQQDVYKCPSCSTHLKLIEDKLSLATETIEEFTEYDLEEIATSINNFNKQIVNLQKIIPYEESKLETKLETEKQINDLISKYIEIPDLDGLNEDLEELQNYYSLQIQKEKKQKHIQYQLDNNILPKNYQTFAHNVEEMYKNITVLLEKVSTYDITQIQNKEQLYNIISDEKYKKDQLKNLKFLETSLINDETKYKSVIETHIGDYNSKYEIIRTEETIQPDIDTQIVNIDELEKKKQTHINNLKQIDLWQKYQNELQNYEKLETKIKILTDHEKEARFKYSSALTLKNKILESESIAMENIVESINIHAREYLDCFFDDNPISVNLQSFKETKKEIKPSINIVIEYKGMECDITMLSGGELSRIVLAYTLALSEMFNTPLLLLDECTASLDQDLTNVVFDGIREHFNGKLVLIIAHQVVSGTFDKIISLNK